jgi:predicted nuclease of predicted toxin-antitoxin system
MTLRILIDMNLAPEWVAALQKHGYEAVHWSTIGDPRAPDDEITRYAQTNDYVIFTHDLNFGAILAATQTQSPSVLQVRTQNTFPEHLEPLVISALSHFQQQLVAGALITIDERTKRVRMLPIRGKNT